jgi:hypothetical protein
MITRRQVKNLERKIGAALRKAAVKPVDIETYGNGHRAPCACAWCEAATTLIADMQAAATPAGALCPRCNQPAVIVYDSGMCSACEINRDRAKGRA